MSNKIQQIIEHLNSLTVLEISTLKKQLEELWGVKAQAAASVAVVAAQPQQESKEAEVTDYQVTLESADPAKKIGVIKVVREVTGLGLKEAKDLVEGAPKVVKESLPKADAESLKKKLEEAGGKVTLKGL